MEEFWRPGAHDLYLARGRERDPGDSCPDCGRSERRCDCPADEEQAKTRYPAEREGA